MYLVFTRMQGESYRRRLRSLLLYWRYVFRALINSLVCWFCTSALGLVLFQICSLCVDSSFASVFDTDGQTVNNDDTSTSRRHLLLSVLINLDKLYHSSLRSSSSDVASDVPLTSSRFQYGDDDAPTLTGWSVSASPCLPVSVSVLVWLCVFGLSLLAYVSLFLSLF